MNRPEGKSRCGKGSLILGIMAIGFTLICSIYALYLITEDSYSKDTDYIIISVGSFFLLAVPAAGIILRRLDRTWINILFLVCSSAILLFVLLVLLVLIALNFRF